MMVLEFLGSAFISSGVGVVCDRLVSWAASNISFSRKRKRDDGRVVVVVLDKLKLKLMAVRPLLNDAEVKQWTDPDVKEWMDEIKHVLYQADDLKDEIATKDMQSKLDSEFPITSNSTTTNTTTHQDVTEGIELRIEAIIEKLEDFVNIAKDSLGLKKVDVVGRNNPPPHRLPQTSSLVDHDFVYGRDNDKEKIIQLLISDSEDDSTGHRVSVIPIVGMGGIGKTTLAQLVYNDPKVDDHFDKKSWVCVSEEFDIVRVTKSILEGLNLETLGDNLDTLQVKLKNGLSGKKFLIVLDDVWNENRSDWLKLRLPFGVGKHGSKIIVTTRQKEVASIMLHDPIAPNQIIDLRELSNEYCWQVFSKHAFGNASPILPTDIERIGKKIVEKCKGLPLAATTLGGMFHNLEVKEWERVLESHFWDLPKEKCDILPALMLSYHHLPSHLKLCFAFCAIIPKDSIFSKHQLVPLWIALGFVEQPTDNRTIEDIGDGYFRELISRSLFQPSSDHDDGFLMHDLINDLAQFVAGKYCLSSDDGHPPDFSKVRYFSYSGKYKFDALKITNEANNLRAIYSFNHWWNSFDLSREDEKVLHDMLPTLRCLRVLSLKGLGISELSDSSGELSDSSGNLNLSGSVINLLETIGNLIHLRYLDLSGSDIEYLPETIGNLIHLRYLDLSYSGIEYLPETIGNLIHLRYLDLSYSGIEYLPETIGNLIHLRYLDLSYSGIECLPETIGNLIHLRHLDLSHSMLKNLPDSIGNLIHLRYFDLSDLESIECLPETICRLCNLETLLLRGCLQITRLPTDLCKLIHLRHLDITITDLSEMPMQIGRLTSLHCLTDFIVGNRNGSAISELRELRDLRGTLSISNLQNVQNARDALEAKLNNKEHLEKLNLEWVYKFESEGEYTSDSENESEYTSDLENESEVLKSQKEMEVLQNLQPHINLKHLTIKNYGGTRFPDWLGDRSFVNLKSLCLCNFSYCCEMPPLGQLPSLQNLTIKIMNSIVKVGSKFYGHDSAGGKPFQSLEILAFKNMPEWETWSILEAGEFCKLLVLVISDCPKLSVEFPKHLPYLKRLEIDGCQGLLTLDGLQNATSLTEIYIDSCMKLKALPERMCTLLPSLQTLRLFNLPEIEYSFLSGGLPSSLVSLTISHCDKLMAGRMDWGLQRLPSLSFCRLQGECEQDKFLESFPEECLLPTSLTTLKISDRPNMISLNPNALRHLNSLATLVIGKCPNLQSLPDEGLPSSLRSLEISGCPLLQVRCEREIGEDWLKISHIPNIHIW